MEKRRVVVSWFALLAWGLLCVAVLGALGGWGAEGLGPYLRAVGAATRDTSRLALYVAAILAYSVALEWTLRHIVQRRLEKMPWAIAVPALLYGATHGIYHVAGVVYATALGVGTAWLYHRVRDWRVSAAWHAQWNVIAVVGTLGLATVTPGSVRDHVLWAYKDAQIQAGTLAWAPGFGWVDLLHRDAARFDRVMQGLERGVRRFALEGRVTSMWGTRHPVRRVYSVPEAELGEMETRAVACRITWELSRAVEQTQATLGLWSGGAMSAYQADDLPAVLHLCLERAGHEVPLVRDVATLRARWAREGMAQLGVEVRTLSLVPGASPTTHARRFLSMVASVSLGEM